MHRSLYLPSDIDAQLHIIWLHYRRIQILLLTRMMGVLQLMIQVEMTLTVVIVEVKKRSATFPFFLTLELNIHLHSIL